MDHIILSTNDCKISIGNHTDPYERYVQLLVNAATFGFAHQTIFTFFVSYNGPNQFNFKEPELPRYYITPRALLPNPEHSGFEDTHSVPEIPCGYTTEMAKKYNNIILDGKYYRLPWDYLCPELKPDVKYIHPNGKRTLSKEELRILWGGELWAIPQAILEYLEKHIEYHAKGLWKDYHFAASYDRFAAKWRVDQTPNRVLRVFDFRQFTPRLVCPESNRYPSPTK